MKKTKIVCTIGPKTESEEMLAKMLDAGMNVMRLNFSHGDYAEHGQRIQNLRNVMSKTGKTAAILLDTKGPEIRTMKLEGGNDVSLKAGQTFTFTTDKSVIGNSEMVAVTYEGFTTDLSVGNTVLVDDGLIGMEVTAIEGNKVICKVLNNGDLGENKGVNLPGVSIALPALAEKDKQDLIFGCEQGVDFVAASFIRKRSDVIEIREHLKAHGGENIHIISKIENQEGLNNFDEILEASDGIMVARGDLGVEIGDPELVGIQKALIRRARQLNRAVITATQMMESMITNPMPTRAEVMDVANAVLDGTDAVMLSAETAAGQYPAETVAAMARVCLGAEKIPSINVSKHRLDVQFDNVEEAIAMSAMYAANHLKGVTAIITMTESGRTALMTSRISSGLPIFAMSRHERTLNLTALYRGVTPVHFDSTNDGVAAAHDAVNLLRDKGYLVSGDIVIVTQGDVMSTIGSTNTTRVMTVE